MADRNCIGPTAPAVDTRSGSWPSSDFDFADGGEDGPGQAGAGAGRVDVQLEVAGWDAAECRCAGPAAGSPARRSRG
ncbi:MAG: hypothetical protein ACRDOK_26200, partial [Streptosporangiaceae bacterium]